MTSDEDTHAGSSSGATLARALPVATTSAVAASMGAEVGPWGAAVAGAAPALVEAVQLADRLRWQRAERAAVQAAAIRGLSLEALVDKLPEDPVRHELLMRVLHAAGTATLEAKVEICAQILADGLDEAAIDEALFLAAALRDLERPHFEVLTLMMEKPSQSCTTEALLADLPRLRRVFPAVVQALLRHGLVVEPAGTWPGDGSAGMTLHLTAHGTSLVALLTAVDDDDR